MPRQKKLTTEEALRKQREDLAVKIAGLDAEIDQHTTAANRLASAKVPMQSALDSLDIALETFGGSDEPQPVKKGRKPKAEG